MEETVIIIGNTCLKHHDSGEASCNREARLIIQALKENGYEIIKLPTGEVTQGDFQNIMIEELEGGTGYEQGSVIGKPDASKKCFSLAQQMLAKAVEEKDKEISELKEDNSAMKYVGQNHQEAINLMIDDNEKLKAELSTKEKEIESMARIIADHPKSTTAIELPSNKEQLAKIIRPILKKYFPETKEYSAGSKGAEMFIDDLFSQFKQAEPQYKAGEENKNGCKDKFHFEDITNFGQCRTCKKNY